MHNLKHITNELDAICVDGEHIAVAIGKDSDSYDTKKDNAARIVRCVNSHDALVASLQSTARCLAWHIDHHGVAMDTEVLKNARAALALAKGE